MHKCLNINRSFFASIIILFLFQACKSENTLFSELDATDSKVTFKNEVKESKDFNVLKYLYFYNGAGVAAGDINNDGKVDLFFVSNQSQNKLYLNKGEKNNAPEFEDISAKAKIEGQANWKTGVSMVDVNNDGYLDIYVCAVNNNQNLKGHNELYINNKNLTFTESAKEYGLDFTGFASQAAFFDFDKDGDLDCYLVTHADLHSKSVDRVNTRMLSNNEAVDYFYKNENGHFVDYSMASDIRNVTMAHGLGISVADYNNDGYQDIYVSNDFHESDYYFVNQKNGTFKDELAQHFTHTSKYSKGCDAADINNDGFQEILTLDFLPKEEKQEKASLADDDVETTIYKKQYGYFKQFSRNCMQFNMSGQKFSDIAGTVGLMATDWSWGPLIADFNNDGIKDVFVSNGIQKRLNNLDYLHFIIGDSLHYGVPTSDKLNQEAIDKMPTGKVHNYIFEGTNSLKFIDQSTNWGFSKQNISNGCTYADLDNDGDLDLITNNFNESAGIFINQSNLNKNNNHLTVKLKGQKDNKFGIGAKVKLFTQSNMQVMEQVPVRGFLSSVGYEMIFGLGKTQVVDSIKIIWPNGLQQTIIKPKINETLALDQKNAANAIDRKNNVKEFYKDISQQINNPFAHKENVFFDFSREPFMPFKVSTEGPKVAMADVNGDGKDDFYVCGAKYQAGELYLATNNGFKLSTNKSFKQDSLYEDVDAVFFDADGDKDQDLYVVSGGNEFFGKMPQLFDRLYLNAGKGIFSRSINALPAMYDNKSCVRPCDFDNDGDIDIFVGGRVVAYSYGKLPKSYLLENNGKGIFKDVSPKMLPDKQELGMITDAQWVDLNKDGLKDLMLVGDWMPIKTLINAKGKFDYQNNGLENEKGLWQSISGGDFDHDGDEDFIVGNLGTNSKLRKDNHPYLKMFMGDFDDTNTYKQVVSYNFEKDWYPIYTKDEMVKRLPTLLEKKYRDNESFAGESIENIISDLSNYNEVSNFNSVYIENLGKGKFKIFNLPTLSQISKVMATLIVDINHDGNLDVLIGGNFGGGSTYQIEYDGFYGLILFGNGHGKFKESLPTENGFLLNGEVRDIKTTKNGMIIVARNNDKLQFFKHI